MKVIKMDDSSILFCKVKIEGYDLVRFDLSRKGGGAACFVKGTVMQIEKALINDCLRVSKVS